MMHAKRLLTFAMMAASGVFAGLYANSWDAGFAVLFGLWAIAGMVELGQ